MRPSGLLHGELLSALAAMGHGDELVVADAGLPTPADVPRIDLAVLPGVPSFEAVLRAVLGEFVVEGATWAEEATGNGSGVDRLLSALLREACPMASFQRVPHEELKRMVRRARLVVRTGEFTPYANVILRGGVPF